MTSHLAKYPGRLTLVGAGPGDPELITLAGVRALGQAQVVIYDRLVSPQLLEHAPQAEHFYVGKQAGHPHARAQQRLRTLIVEHASRGRHVVRLKGGDPMLFGRGAEEIQLARQHGFELRIIPGVTAALGAAASLQTSLTERFIASSVAFVAGCGAPAEHGGQEEEPRADWSQLAQAVDTLVIYMGGRHLRQIAQALRAAGRPGEEPVAIIQDATGEHQTVSRISLEEAAGSSPAITRNDPSLPVLVIVGQAVRTQQAELLVALAQTNGQAV